MYQTVPMTVAQALKASETYYSPVNGDMVSVLADAVRRFQDAHYILTVIDERMGAGWTRELAHSLFNHAAPQSETPVSTLCAVCDQIKELHPSSHEWTAKETFAEPAIDQAPIARVIVTDDAPAGVVLYAPGLPPGEFDVYLEPTKGEQG